MILNRKIDIRLMNKAMLLQSLAGFMELLDYPVVRLLPWLPALVYGFYMRAIKRKNVSTRTFLILIIIGGLVSTWLTWLSVMRT